MRRKYVPIRDRFIGCFTSPNLKFSPESSKGRLWIGRTTPVVKGFCVAFAGRGVGEEVDGVGAMLNA